LPKKNTRYEINIGNHHNIFDENVLRWCSSIAHAIEGSLNQKEFVLGVFLDIDGAFDNASFDSIDAASGEHGVVLTLRR
jgi:hypothetical protein